MFDRVELKARAKNYVMGNYWYVVLVAIIFSISVGGAVSIVQQKYISDYNTDVKNITNYPGNVFSSEEIYDAELYYFFNGATISEAQLEQIADELWQLMMDLLKIMLIIAAINFVVTTFILVPIEIGCRRWFLRNRTGKPSLEEITCVFRGGYLNTIKIMFLRGLFTFLWSLLLIIPGIVKAYEYRMIPFLLAENPNMDRREAFARSRDLMMGNKGDAFVLDLSFIGWYFLSSCTFGILNVFWVTPYVCATDTELYVELCMRANSGNQDYYDTNNGNNRYDNGSYNNNGNNQYDSGSNEDRDYRNQSGIDPDMFN